MTRLPETEVALREDDPAGLIELEWLVANGLGGYASATPAGVNSRRYHGLLVAATKPPEGRRILLANIIEALEAPGGSFELSTNEYEDGTLHPQGLRHLVSFKLKGARPVFTFKAGPWLVEKTVWMDHGQNRTWMRYTLLSGPGAVELKLLPLITNRDFHSEMRAAQMPRFEAEMAGESVVIRWPDGPPLVIKPHGRARVDLLRLWFWNVAQRRERERGFDWVEDLAAPCAIHAQLEPGGSFALSASLGDAPESGPDESLSAFDGRALGIIRSVAESEDTPTARLVLAADQFLVRREDKDPGAVIAGYHWFGEWGRDTMIALPGLALATGRPQAARNILVEYADYMSEGMLPNRFPVPGAAPEYTSADATLWWFEAVARYLAATGDESILQKVLTAMVSAVDWHLKGTRHGIGADPADGLLRAGAPGLQLTWMDAKVGDWVVTPRIGKPVEINALWYSALRLVEQWLMRVGMDTGKVRGLADRVAVSFRKRFWNDRRGCLFDVIDGPTGDDASLRPNQLFALALTNPLLHGERARSLVGAVREKLLTPYGLRTLAPDEPAYAGRYAGGPAERDGAYHQGTVWPWLIGAYVDAHLHAYGSAEGLEGVLDPLLGELERAGVGSMSEVFDGDAPHRPGGCVAQAWSVAEVLRAYSRLRRAGLTT